MFSVLLICLMCFHAQGQDTDCDYSQSVQPNQGYVIASPNYSASYPRNKVCRWVANCPSGYQLRLDCYLEMPLTTGCMGDRVLISRTGDPLLQSAERYCGRQTLTAVMSAGQSLSQGLITLANSTGGRFICNITAQAIPPVQPSCVCGVRKQNRIVGGTEAGAHEFPMMAGVIERAIDSILCGAVIIAAPYALTAAHCLENQTPAGIEITVGDSNIKSGKRYDVYSYLVHQNYNPTTLDYDIGLIRVRVPIVFSDYVSPVCLPFNYQGVDLTGVNSTIPGWGTLFPGGPTAQNLRYATVQIISNQQCQQTDVATSRQLCSYTAGKDACQFDSGGPLMIVNGRTGRLVNMGIVSSGSDCASRRPGINTRVTEFLQWIVNNAPADYCVLPPP